MGKKKGSRILLPVIFMTHIIFFTLGTYAILYLTTYPRKEILEKI
jgi:hypothetical protein